MEFKESESSLYQRRLQLHKRLQPSSLDLLNTAWKKGSHLTLETATDALQSLLEILPAHVSADFALEHLSNHNFQIEHAAAGLLDDTRPSKKRSRWENDEKNEASESDEKDEASEEEEEKVTRRKRKYRSQEG